MGLLGVIGCGGLEPVVTHEVETDPVRLYMALTLEQRAINLATEPPYHTVQLVATPRDGRDSVMSGLPAPRFYLRFPADSSKLQVTPEGLVTARAAGSRIPVIVELVAPGPVQHVDSALVTVTSGAPPVLDRLSIDPASPESALWPMGADLVYATGFLPIAGYVPPVLAPQPLDAVGQPIAGLVVEFASLNPARAEVDRWTGQVKPRRPGPVQVVARTTAYGVTKVDTALYTVSWQIEAQVAVVPGPSGVGVLRPTEVWIVPNALMLFSNLSSDSIDVTFDDPTNVAQAPAPICDLFLSLGLSICGTGDMLVPPLDPSGAPTYLRLRSFPVPGVYTYHSARTGATGRIVVTTEVPAGMVEP